MKTFKVFQHSDGSTEGVKQGWSWPAFFFGPFWAMVKRMWGIGIGVLVAFFLLGFVSAFTGDAAGAVTNVAGLGVSILFGVMGNQWRVNHMQSRGYQEVDTVDAKNPEEATARFLQTPRP